MSEHRAGGETYVSDDAIASIVAIVVREVEGVSEVGTSSIRRIAPERAGPSKRAREVDLEAAAPEAIINLTVTTLYGYKIPDIVGQIREKLTQRLRDMVGIIPREINVEVTEIVYPEEAATEAQ